MDLDPRIDDSEQSNESSLVWLLDEMSISYSRMPYVIAWTLDESSSYDAHSLGAQAGPD